MSNAPRLYLDLETCGLHGMPILAQYAVEDGPITIYEVWRHPVQETLKLIEWFCEHAVVGFNLSFDWFHVCKIYNIFRLCDPDWIPADHIQEIALLEPKGQDGPCIKPASALDLMLHSRKGPFQSLMARDDVRIRRVPTALAEDLADELEQRVEIDGIYFARQADKNAPRWGVYDRKKKDGTIDPDFKDVVLKFKPAGGLKFLAEHVLGLPPKAHFEDIELPRHYRPKELGYAPTALAVAKPPDWEVYEDRDIVGYAWPALIKYHIDHWATNEPAREYAKNDIVYTRALDEHFGRPEPGDNDSTLACMVAAVRWHGFTIDRPGIQELLCRAKQVVAASPVNINKPTEVRAYITAAMDEVESLVLDESTKKANLEAITAWEITEREQHGDGWLEPGPHPAAVRAKEVLDVKFASKEIELYSKLLLANKFHASFVVIGTLSSRMSGGDGLNAQGIKHSKEVRQMFPLAWNGMVLCGGDFAAFEVTIADAVCNDEALRAELLAGKKIHALFGMAIFPGKTYEEVKASDGTDNDMYTKAKQGFFGTMLYGGDHSTLVKKLGIREDVARAAIENFGKRFTGVKRWRKSVSDRFCSMTQPGGIGTKVIWKDPADYCETFLGFRRYYTLENHICKALFDLARKPPKDWKDCKIKVLRSNRVQTAGGAVASALYGAAFQLQAANMRSAANHEVQSPGAEITKHVERKIWECQPAGVNDWYVAPINVHDEILCVARPELTSTITDVVRQSIEHFRPRVPLLGMDWNENAAHWADAKHGTLKIRPPPVEANTSAQGNS